MEIMGIFTWLADKFLDIADSRIKVRVLVHEGYFLNNPTPYYFVKVMSLSPKTPITITHAWVVDGKEKKDFINLKRPLPYKLSQSDQWETWLPKNSIVNRKNIFRNVRILLSNNKICKSRKNKGVPSMGYVACEKISL